MTNEITFPIWKNDVIEQFKKMLGKKYLNDENLTFLLGNEKYLFADYETGITAKTHAQLAWCDNNLQYEEGRLISLIENENYL